MKLITKVQERFSPRVGSSLTRHEQEKIETSLKEIFTYVAPRPAFVENLGKQLARTPVPRRKAPQLPQEDGKITETLLLGATLAVGILVFFLTSFRMVLALLGAFGLMLQWLSRKRGEKIPVVQTTA